LASWVILGVYSPEWMDISFLGISFDGPSHGPDS
jgi:hypothetical protein